MSIVYEVKCDCGSELDVLGCELDSDNDLCVTVSKCEDCEVEVTSKCEVEYESLVKEHEEEVQANAAVHEKEVAELQAELQAEADRLRASLDTYMSHAPAP